MGLIKIIAVVICLGLLSIAAWWFYLTYIIKKKSSNNTSIAGVNTGNLGTAYSYPIIQLNQCDQFNTLIAWGDSTAEQTSGPLIFQSIAGWAGKLKADNFRYEVPALSLCTTSDQASGRIIPIWLSSVWTNSTISSTYVNATRIDFFQQPTAQNPVFVGYLYATNSPLTYSQPSLVAPGVNLQPVSIYRWTGLSGSTQLYYEILYPSVELSITLYGTLYNLRCCAGYVC